MPLTQSAGIALEGLASAPPAATLAGIPKVVPFGGVMDMGVSVPFGLGVVAADLEFITVTARINGVGSINIAPSSPPGWPSGETGTLSGGSPKVWRLHGRVADGTAGDAPTLRYTATGAPASMPVGAMRWALRGITSAVFLSNGRLHSAAGGVTVPASVTIPASTVIVCMASSSTPGTPPTLAVPNTFAISPGASVSPSNSSIPPYSLAWAYFPVAGTWALPVWANATVDIPGSLARDPAGWVAYTVTVPPPPSTSQGIYYRRRSGSVVGLGRGIG